MNPETAPLNPETLRGATAERIRARLKGIGCSLRRRAHLQNVIAARDELRTCLPYSLKLGLLLCLHLMYVGVSENRGP